MWWVKMVNEPQNRFHKTAPLAEQFRPQSFLEFVGQSHLLAPHQPLYKALQGGDIHSMVLWGPPGSGKTTLARLLATQHRYCFLALSAVLSGVKEIRAAISTAQQRDTVQFQGTVLFVDEVHRFNKSQQDAFLPYIENGTLIFIGATTENPSFSLNRALLSRLRVYVLQNLSLDEIHRIVANALQRLNTEKKRDITFAADALALLIQAAHGDARRALNLLEIVLKTNADVSVQPIALAQVQALLAHHDQHFDKQGDYFYDLISALHKSIRGSSPDAALYWLARMLKGGCDPLYIARRLVRIASEDVGNADPRALEISLNAWQVYERLGSPEGELALAQAAVYLACAAKSNAVYVAFAKAQQDAEQQGTLAIPLHLRNAPTALMEKIGAGKNYRYAHDEQHAYAAGEQYLPAELQARVYYEPVDRGLETKILEKLNYLRALDKHALSRENPSGGSR